MGPRAERIIIYTGTHGRMHDRPRGAGRRGGRGAAGGAGHACARNRCAVDRRAPALRAWLLPHWKTWGPVAGSKAPRPRPRRARRASPLPRTITPPPGHLDLSMMHLPLAISVAWLFVCRSIETLASRCTGD